MTGTIYTQESLTAMDVDDVALAARMSTPILIIGGTTPDREACARFIHASGSHARGPFVPHSPRHTGRLLGAEEALDRRFDQARGGTLFVDDIDALTPAMQQDFLSLLDRCGAVGPVRVITGSGAQMDGERAAGSFDEALYYRLNVIRVDLDHRTSLAPPAFSSASASSPER